MMKMERICIYPGSFDPPTVGHMDLIRRGAKLFDRVVVAVLHNVSKHCAFTAQERVEMLRKACCDLPNVEAVSFEGLTADLARQMHACAMLRGVRSIKDYESEMTLAQLNTMLAPEVETVLLLTRPEHGCISSSAVKELAHFGGDFSPLVPACLAERIKQRLVCGHD